VVQWTSHRGICTVLRAAAACIGTVACADWSRHKFAEFFCPQPGLARIASLEEIRAKDGNLGIPLYVAPAPTIEQE
jgi:hypothetical protein